MSDIKLNFDPSWTIEFTDMEIDDKGIKLFVTGRAKAYAASMVNHDNFKDITYGEMTSKHIECVDDALICWIESDEMRSNNDKSIQLNERASHDFFSHLYPSIIEKLEEKLGL
jgi:hypothetical protein